MRTHDATSQRQHWARRFLFVAFLLQRIGDGLVLWATCSLEHPEPFLRGLAVGAVAAGVVFLGATWRRLRWARYVLVTFSCGYVFVVYMAALRRWSDYAFGPYDPRILMITGAFFYLLSVALLVRSKRVRRYANL